MQPGASRLHWADVAAAVGAEITLNGRTGAKVFELRVLAMPHMSVLCGISCNVSFGYEGLMSRIQCAVSVLLMVVLATLVVALVHHWLSLSSGRMTRYPSGRSHDGQVMTHDAPPQIAEQVPAEVLSKGKMLLSSAYYQHVKELNQHVVGRTVKRTAAGTSGFCLYLDNGKWVIAHLAEDGFRWKLGENTPTSVDSGLINSVSCGDASRPLGDDRPYGDQACDFSAEVNKAVGKPITGLSYGDQCFGFCFPEGRELDVTLRRDANGKQAYRVYWEQW